MKREDLYTVHLVDGLPTQIDQKSVCYKTVRLREINVNDMTAATEMAERLVTVRGKTVLVMSDELYSKAISTRYIKQFEAAGLQPIGQELLNLDLLGKLNPYDLARIEERIALLEMVTQARYGLIDTKQLDAYLESLDEHGRRRPDPALEATSAPQPQGQADELAQGGASAEPGPAMLASHAGGPATRAPRSARQ